MQFSDHGKSISRRAVLLFQAGNHDTHGRVSAAENNSHETCSAHTRSSKGKQGFHHPSIDIYRSIPTCASVRIVILSPTQRRSSQSSHGLVQSVNVYFLFCYCFLSWHIVPCCHCILAVSYPLFVSHCMTRTIHNLDGRLARACKPVQHLFDTDQSQIDVENCQPLFLGFRHQHVCAFRWMVTYIGHAREGQDVADDRKLPQEAENDWEEVAVVPKGIRGNSYQVCQHVYTFLILQPLGLMTYPNRFKNPKASTSIPITAHLQKTRIMPVKKQIVPLIFCFLAKK